MTYAQLQADVIEFATRDDVSTKVPTFIRMGEAELYRRCRVLEMEEDVTLTFTSPNYDSAIPTGFLGFKRLTLSDAPINNAKTKYLGPDQFHSLNALSPADFGALAGDARLLWTMESSKLKVCQPAGSAEPIELTGVYFKRFEPLSGSNTSNALLEAHPDLFLYAALAQLWDWADETEMLAKYIAKMDKVIGQIDDLERQRRRAPGEWSRSAPRGVVV